MISETTDYYAVVSQMPEDTVVIFHDVPWEEYEELLAQVGEAPGLRISYDDGTLKVLTLSSEHEKYTRFIEKLVTLLSLRLEIRILSFGSATMKKSKRRKGNEPDCCFYVQTAAALGKRIKLDFAVDPPPDVAVEVDVHHASQEKFSIYAALGVPEIWRFDGQQLFIHMWQEDQYVEAEVSRALPMLTSRILTEYLTRMREEGEFEAIIAFDEWLQSLKP
jgi:Uma2 family endonuclease